MWRTLWPPARNMYRFLWNDVLTVTGYAFAVNFDKTIKMSCA